MSEQFSRLARWSAQRPRQVQWGITALMFVTCVGFLGFHFEDRPEELWALEGSELVEALHYMRTIPSWDDGENLFFSIFIIRGHFSLTDSPVFKDL